MKRIMILFLAVGMSAGVMAQRIQYPNNLQDKKSYTLTEQTFKKQSSDMSKADVFLYPSSFSTCGHIDSTYIYRYSDSQTQQPIPGFYVTGSNLADDRAYAQQYTRTQAISVKGVGAVLAFMDNQYGNDNLTAKMYSASSVGIGNELASKSFTSSVLTDQQIGEYQFMFTTPVSSSNFAVALSVPGLEVDQDNYVINNFVIIASTKINCASGGKSYVFRADQSGNYSWVKFSDALSGQDLDLFIFPIVDATHGLTSVDVNELSYVYPNPAKDEVIIASSIEMNKVEIYNMVGQKVYESNAGGISARVNVANFNTGSYVAKIYTEAGIATKKIIVE
ncbi:MAG: T9SS type A sorting domain-containing protein [Bacteroidales bacterium]